MIPHAPLNGVTFFVASEDVLHPRIQIPFCHVARTFFHQLVVKSVWRAFVSLSFSSPLL